MTVDQFLVELELMGAWRQGLDERMALAHEAIETVGLSPELHDALIAEARSFSAVCAALAAKGGPQ